MKIEQPDEVISEIMEKFDFQKVHAVMILTDWKWREIRVPTLEELRDHAHWFLINACFAEGDYTGGSGGFTAYKCDGEVSLVFELESYIWSK